MKKLSTKDGTLLAGLVTAAAASLCCITPVLALLSGTSSIASTFAWMERYRPFLIVITVALLGFAWYRKLNPPKGNVQCACEEKPSFWQSNTFLGMVTGLAVLLMVFPFYSKVFFSKQETRQVIIVEKTSIRRVKFDIRGMSCVACTETVDLALSKVPGVLKYDTRFKDHSSLVTYDGTKVKEAEIVKEINATGYQVGKTTPF